MLGRENRIHLVNICVSRTLSHFHPGAAWYVGLPNYEDSIRNSRFCSPDFSVSEPAALIRVSEGVNGHLGFGALAFCGRLLMVRLRSLRVEDTTGARGSVFSEIPYLIRDVFPKGGIAHIELYILNILDEQAQRVYYNTRT
jgi:hypothetical protein